MTIEEIAKKLEKFNVCPSSVTWLRTQPDPETAWRAATSMDREWLLARFKPLYEQYYAALKPLDEQYRAALKPLYEQYYAALKPLDEQYRVARKALLAEIPIEKIIAALEKL